MSNKQILRVDGISKNYGAVKALSDVDLSIDEGCIHCIVGENGSGKSTLIKIISGVVNPDKGKIYLNGKCYKKLNPIISLAEGVQVIYQDLALFSNLTVAENIAINQLIEEKRRFFNWRRLREIAQIEMEKIGKSLNMDDYVGEISISDRQIVAIIRALTLNAKLIIMDEPTTALTDKEINSLFEIINKLKKDNISTLFITHKLSEVFNISENVTVIRDGEIVGTYKTKKIDNDKLIYLMTGLKLDRIPVTYRKFGKNIKPALEIRNLSKRNNYRNINFKIYPGEICGIIGLLGSGRTELAKSLYGLNKPDSGEIFIYGNKTVIGSPTDAINFGINLLPEDRLSEGLFIEQPISTNLVVTIFKRVLNRLKFFSKNKKNEIAWDISTSLGIKTPSVELNVSSLSGGNQQKVVLGKCVTTEPKILILDSPTVGIDVASKNVIHKIIRDLANKGIAILIISDEIQEIIWNCHKVLIMLRGSIKHEIDARTIDDSTMEKLIGINS